MKKILFRADGNASTGLGHMYRLFALVEMLKDDYEYIYLTKQSSELAIIPKEYNVQVLDTEISYLDEPRWLFENFSSQEYILICDGYQFISEYQKRVKELDYQLVYIDDLAQEYMYADIVVNHAPGFLKESYKGENYTQYLLGTDYALLRPEFLIKAKQNKNIKYSNKDIISDIFICFGGSDYNDLTLKTVKSLLEEGSEVKNINVVLGSSYKNEGIYQIEDKRLNIYKNISSKQLSTLICNSTLGIVPCSTICFELFSSRIPVISGYFVENQEKAYENFLDLGCFHGIGSFNEFDFNSLYSFVLQMLDDYSYLESILLNQIKYLDGNQSQRFKQVISEL